jgi:hypothetical protein
MLYDRMSERANDGRFMMNIGSTNASPEYIIPQTVAKDDDDSSMGTAGEHKMSGDDELGDSRDHECWNIIHTKIYILLLYDYMRRRRTCEETEYSDTNQNILTTAT